MIKYCQRLTLRAFNNSIRRSVAIRATVYPMCLFASKINPLFSVVLAAAYTLLESPEEAAVVAKKLLETHPNFNLSQWKYLSSWKSEENRTRLYKAAKKAGVPEFPKDK